MNRFAPNVRFRLVSALLTCAALSLPALRLSRAAEPQRPLEQRNYGKAELRYVEGMPLLLVRGTPEEIGRDCGELTKAAIKSLVEVPKQLARRHAGNAAWPLVATAGRALLSHASDDHQAEVKASARQSAIDFDVLAVANTMIELRRLGGCSALVVPPGQSETGGPLFGRNFDFDSFGVMDRLNLVVVCRPDGKHAFAAVGYPGLFAVISGMNDAGLAVATLDVYESKDGSPIFNPEGVPLGFSFRRILEECETVDEAVKLMRSVERTTWMNLAVCDRHGGAILEITPKSVEVRRGSGGLLPCTNHFRTPKLSRSTSCWRYDVFSRLPKDEKLGVADVKRALHAVNQGKLTLQTMVFEPAALKLHLALGKPPSSAHPLKTIDLAPLFKGED